MAWIEDPAREVLLVRQTAGLKLWTLPGGEVKRGESLIKVLKREVREETGLKVQVGSHLRLLDRRDKDAITLLRVRLRCPLNCARRTRARTRQITRFRFCSYRQRSNAPGLAYRNGIACCGGAAAGYFCEEWHGQPTEKGPVGFSPHWPCC